MSIVPIRPPRRLTLLSGLAVGVLVLTLTAGCSKSGGPAADPKANQGLSGVDGTPATDATGNPTGNPSTTSTSPAAHPSAKTSTGAAGAQIVTFKVTQQPLCSIVGTTDAPFHQDALDIILTWQVTGATGVELYIDNGLYDSYGPTGTQQLYFACETKPKQSHTYKLVTKGGSAKTASKSLTVTADNNPPQ